MLLAVKIIYWRWLILLLYICFLFFVFFKLGPKSGHWDSSKGVKVYFNYQNNDELSGELTSGWFQSGDKWRRGRDARWEQGDLLNQEVEWEVARVKWESKVEQVCGWGGEDWEQIGVTCTVWMSIGKYLAADGRLLSLYVDVAHAHKKSRSMWQRWHICVSFNACWLT